MATVALTAQPLHPEAQPRLKLAALSNAEIDRLARERVIAERGERPAHTSVGSWSGYPTVSNEALGEEFSRMMAINHAARAWDRRKNEIAREIADKVGAA